MKLFIILIIFIGVHTRLTINVTPEVPVPTTICLFGAVLGAAYIGLGGISRQLLVEWRMVLFILLGIVVNLLSVQSEYYLKSLTGVLQLVYSLAISLILVALMKKTPRDVLGQGALILIVAISFGAALEALGPLKSISDTFRTIALPNWYYENDVRDIDIHSHVRAKVFSPEPSTAAISLYCLSMVFILSSPQKALRLVVWAISILVAFMAIGSPINAITIFMGIGTLTIFWLEKLLRRRQLLELLGAIGISGCIITLLVSVLVCSMEERINQINSGEGSFIVRISGANNFCVEFVQRHPFIGIGIVGDLTVLVGELRDYYFKHGASWITLCDDSEVSKMVSNSIALHFIYWGGIMGVVGLFVLLSAMRIPSMGRMLLVFFLTAVLWMSMGGYNTPALWCMSAMIVLAGRKRIEIKEMRSGQM